MAVSKGVRTREDLVTVLGFPLLGTGSGVSAEHGRWGIGVSSVDSDNRWMAT